MTTSEHQLAATWRDHAWIAFALLVAAGTISVVADAGLLLGALMLLAGLWFVVGAWRRTVWGCPFSHAKLRALHNRVPDMNSDRPLQARAAGTPNTPGSAPHRSFGEQLFPTGSLALRRAVPGRLR